MSVKVWDRLRLCPVQFEECNLYFCFHFAWKLNNGFGFTLFIVTLYSAVSLKYHTAGTIWYLARFHYSGNGSTSFFRWTTLYMSSTWQRSFKYQFEIFGFTRPGMESPTFQTRSERPNQSATELVCVFIMLNRIIKAYISYLWRIRISFFSI